MDPHELLKHFEARRASIVDEIRELVDIESPSFDAEASSRVADWLESKFAGISDEFLVERIVADEVGEHVIVRAFDGEGPRTLLLGHTDTVHPVGTALSNPTRIEAGRLFGCGVFDMKANVVLILEALRYLASTDTRPAGPLTVLLSCDEEVGSYTGRELVEREASKSEFCYVFEPSAAGCVKTGRKGTGMFTVKAHGIPAHAGLEPEKGASAILEISRQIEKLHTLNNVSARTTVNVCTAKGGTTTNVIPEHAECSVDVRFSTMEEATRIDAGISALEPFDKRVSLEISGGINRPPMERTDAVVALFEKARQFAASFDYELGETQVGGASDGNFVAALGVTVLDGLGITGAGAHTLEEHILVSDIANRATLVTLLLV